MSFSPARQALCASTAYVALGDAQPAEDEATTALERFAELPVAEQWPAGVMGARIDLSMAWAMRGDLAGAEDALLPVFDLTPDRRTEALARRLGDLRRILVTRPYRGATAQAASTPVSLPGSSPSRLARGWATAASPLCIQFHTSVITSASGRVVYPAARARLSSTCQADGSVCHSGISTHGLTCSDNHCSSVIHSKTAVEPVTRRQTSRNVAKLAGVPARLNAPASPPAAHTTNTDTSRTSTGAIVAAGSPGASTVPPRATRRSRRAAVRCTHAARS